MSEEMLKAYVFEEQYPMETAERKIRLPEEMDAGEPFAVQKFHIDTNHHVNNEKYILMAEEISPRKSVCGKCAWITARRRCSGI